MPAPAKQSILQCNSHWIVTISNTRNISSGVIWPKLQCLSCTTFRTRLLVHSFSMVIHFMRRLWLFPSTSLPFITEKWMINWPCLNSPEVTLLSNSNFLNDEQNFRVFFFISHHVYHQKEFSKYSRAHSAFLVYGRFKRTNRKFLQIHMCNIK